MQHRVCGNGAEPVGIGFPAEILEPRPRGVRVRGLDPAPPLPLLEHPERLPAQGLSDLLGVLRRLGAQGRELACERMFA